MAMAGAGPLLARQLKQMQSDKDIPGISCGIADDNIFEWEVMLMISDECRFYGGMQYNSDSLTLKSICIPAMMLTMFSRT